jgi:hypothetical protein
MNELEVAIERASGNRLYYWQVRNPEGEILASSQRGSKSAEQALEQYRSFVSLAPSLPVIIPNTRG